MLNGILEYYNYWLHFINLLGKLPSTWICALIFDGGNKLLFYWHMMPMVSSLMKSIILTTFILSFALFFTMAWSESSFCFITSIDWSMDMSSIILSSKLLHCQKFICKWYGAWFVVIWPALVSHTCWDISLNIKSVTI